MEARRWINAKIHELVETNEDGEKEASTIIIDGGTEGFQGQARVIHPFKTACYECTLATLPPEQSYPLCTIKEIPRLPEHCIQYAFMVLWPEHFPDRAMDKDDPKDMQWVCDRAKERADAYKIKGVDYKLTMGVTKNIIPAIASTNALVSAACTNEAVKILSGCNNRVDNYMQYLGQTRTTCTAIQYEKDPNCLVCGTMTITMEAKSDEKLGDYLERLKDKHKFKNPTIKPNNSDYLAATGLFAKNAEGKNEKTFAELVEAGQLTAGGDKCSLIDANVPGQLTLIILVN